MPKSELVVFAPAEATVTNDVATDVQGGVKDAGAETQVENTQTARAEALYVDDHTDLNDIVLGADPTLTAERIRTRADMDRKLMDDPWYRYVVEVSGLSRVPMEKMINDFVEEKDRWAAGPQVQPTLVPSPILVANQNQAVARLRAMTRLKDTEAKQLYDGDTTTASMFAKLVATQILLTEFMSGTRFALDRNYRRLRDQEARLIEYFRRLDGDLRLRRRPGRSVPSSKLYHPYRVPRHA